MESQQKGSNNGNLDVDYLIAGGFSGFFTRLVSQPLDVLKIRFQLQVEPIKPNIESKYHSLMQAFNLMVKEERVVSLWKGHVPAQLLSITYGMGQFYSYHIFMEESKKLPMFEEWKNPLRFINGAIAGCIGTAISYPFDTLRTRLIGQSSNNMIYKGMIHGCAEILLKESPTALFRGLTPTLIQIAPQTGAQLLFYEICKDIYKWFWDEAHDATTSTTNSLISGTISGFAAKTLIYPLDFVKKRLQIQGFEQGRKSFGKFFKCNGMFDCIVRTIMKEGITGMYKGLIPSQLKAAVTSALYFSSYEYCLRLLQMLRHI